MKLKVKNTKNVSNIIYYDSNTRIVYNKTGNNIVPYVKKLDNKLRIVSAFPFDALMKATIEVPKNIDEMDIEAFLTENVYKQLNISPEVDYELCYFKMDFGFDADNWTYDVYLVDDKYLEKTYGELKDRTQFIDVVTSASFLPLVLYKTDKLDTISNHIFVFIGENSSTFSFYSKGEPVYMKTLSSNIHKLRVEFNQESSLELNSIEFENFIAGKSPDIANYKSYIDSMLNKISRDIEENIMYIKRVYQDLDPTMIYYGMSIEYDNEFLSFFRDAFLIETKPLNLLASITTQKGLFATADIAITYASYLISNPGSLPNFSHLKRPKPLSQRESAQFVMIASGLFVLSLLYPIYNFGMTSFFSVRGDMLQKSYDTEIFPKAEQFRADEENLKKQIENLQQQKQAVDKEIIAMRGDMDDIHTWQVAYIQKSKILNDILQVANNSKVRVIKATAASNNNQDLVVELNLFAKSQEDITDFIKVLNQKNDYKSVFTDKIEKISLSKESNDDLTSRAQTFASAVSGNVANVANTAVDAASNALSNLNNNATQLQSISAKVNLENNEELGRSVSGYLNSIVKVVVR
ncbi:hypothetical protein CCY99_07830 [Helicobacter sp. 16-1353]|uniref:hypothetical protein n=1 Tax=Helicobacter sp. 16-1353 TaxID=2004996 RepID=UPI000DCC5EB8|nr:hypothetical protein [Helicobacter sp. 16-1353]RAX52051.1 hypothetical protein CCY99_07830 [Helicobacter sp. 16-1353]